METALSSLATAEGQMWQVLHIVCPVQLARPLGTSTCRIFLASQLICIIFLVTESCFQLFVLLFNIPSYFFSFAHFMLATHAKMFFFFPRSGQNVTSCLQSSSVQESTWRRQSHRGYASSLWLTLRTGKDGSTSYSGSMQHKELEITVFSKCGEVIVCPLGNYF